MPGSRGGLAAAARVAERLAEHRRAFMARLEQWETDNVAERIWARDASLWSASGARPDAIVDRLGWLDLPESMRGRLV